MRVIHLTIRADWLTIITGDGLKLLSTGDCYRPLDFMLGKQNDSERHIDAPPAPRACPACGAMMRRVDASFCPTCGRGLHEDEGYLPADALRASYHQHQQARRPAPVVAAFTSVRPKPRGVRVRSNNHAMPLMKNSNGASTTALAFATYALVPYLGILFCPGALLMGGIGFVRARRAPRHDSGRRAALLSITLGLVLLCVQLLLWWILYKVPEWAKQ